MKTFACTKCGNKVHFENFRCLKCEHALGFDPVRMAMVALRPLPDKADVFTVARGDATQLRYCANKQHNVCNWLTSAAENAGFCIACSLNRTIPNLSEWGSLYAWYQLEKAKKRLVYSLLRFGLPLDANALGKGQLTFDFARHTQTGHLDGVITIDVMEADAVERERQRQHFAEPYRSLLGHLRHESGHFYWMVLVEAGGRLEDFRTLFGDEQQNYAEALARHHTGIPAPDWQSGYVSAYAGAHPWEDWAETWAHYLHMVDAVETAEAVGMEPRAAGLILGSIWPFKAYDIYRDETFQALIERWVPLTIAMNGLNRSMGHDDFYPFVVSSRVREKLAFVHRVIREQRR